MPQLRWVLIGDSLTIKVLMSCVIWLLLDWRNYGAYHWRGVQWIRDFRLQCESPGYCPSIREYSDGPVQRNRNNRRSHMSNSHWQHNEGSGEWQLRCIRSDYQALILDKCLLVTHYKEGEWDLIYDSEWIFSRHIINGSNFQNGISHSVEAQGSESRGHSE